MTIAELITLLQALPPDAIVKRGVPEYRDGNWRYEDVEPESVKLDGSKSPHLLNMLIL